MNVTTIMREGSVGKGAFRGRIVLFWDQVPVLGNYLKEQVRNSISLASDGGEKMKPQEAPNLF